MEVSSALLPIIPVQLTNPPAAVALLLDTSDGKRSGGISGGGCGNRPKEKCKTVPEGGSPFSYLGLAGLVCIAAIVYRRRTTPG